MSGAREFAAQVVDLLRAFGHCEARRMFGGYGIFHQGLMFGLIAEGNLYLKADAESRQHFDAKGRLAFSYYRKEREYRLSYFQAPDDFFDDETTCLRWAHLAFDAALRNPDRRKKNKP